jgi:glyoxylase-like metal-dependent hydrolase (beta-lactamase superfamily II)
MEIIPGVHKVDGVSGANCYLAASGTDLVLIDAGMRGSSKKIESYLKTLGKSLSDIKYIFITHADPDHISGAMEIKELSGAKLVIHNGEMPALAGDSSSRLRNKSRFVKILSKLLSGLIPFPSAKPDIIIKEDTEIAGFKIINTPGHSDGSISIYLPVKVIFVGDALTADKKGNPKRPMKPLAADIVQAKASVELIAGLDYDTLLVGHGAPVKGDAVAKVKKLLADWK